MENPTQHDKGQDKEKPVNRNTTPVAFTLDAERLAWVDRQAKEKRLNRSELLRRIIDELREAEKKS